MLKIPARNILIICLISLFIIDFLVLFNLDLLHLRTIVTLFFFLFTPGFLTVLLFRLHRLSFWQLLVYSVSLSVAFLMVLGILANWFLPLFINDPLTQNPLLVCFNIVYLVIWKKVYDDNKIYLFHIPFKKPDLLNGMFFLLPPLFIVSSVFGAILINNHATNLLSMAVIIAISFYVLLCGILNKKLHNNLYPWATFLISIALLFLYSLRSWHISGWDINQEFYVYQLTKLHKFWSINTFHNAYNACISITIFPTIISLFTNLQDELIFKILYPVLFSLLPVILYLTSKRYVSHYMAFLSAFFFMSQWMFLNEYPALSRESVALTFLALMIHTLFTDTISDRVKKLLFLILGFGVIISHYSTAYFTLYLFIGLYIVTFLFSRLKTKISFLKSLDFQHRLSLSTIIILTLLTFLWNVQLTGTAGNISKVLSNTFHSIEKPSSSSTTFTNISYTRLLEKYSANPKNLDAKKRQLMGLYTPQLTKNYQITSIFNDYPPEMNHTVWEIMNKALSVITDLSFIFLFIGGIYLLMKINKNSIDPEYLILSGTYITLIGLVLVIPNGASTFGPIRVYQQSLLLLAPIYIIGAVTLFNIVKLKKNIILVALIFVIYFLFYSTLIQRIIGGVSLSADTFSLANQGTYYDFYYTQDAEVKSAKWLSQNYDHHSNIFADEVANLRLLAFGSLTNANFELLPSSIDTGAYVYLDYRNLIKKMSVNKYLNTYYLKYNYPLKFLDKNKNLIYNNGTSEIFK